MLNIATEFGAVVAGSHACASPLAGHMNQVAEPVARMAAIAALAAETHCSVGRLGSFARLKMTAFVLWMLATRDQKSDLNTEFWIVAADVIPGPGPSFEVAGSG